MTLRVPPGRGGRAWLKDRLSTAERGAEVLDDKLRMLVREQERMAQAAERTRIAWEGACQEAERWLFRAAAVGGQRSLDLIGPAGPAQVALTWHSVMGVRYPADARVTAGERGSDTPVASNTALLHAQAAFADALQAAAQHAAALEARRRIDQEAASTRRRVRALKDRLLPELRSQLRLREAVLEELEHEDAVRLLWAAGHGSQP